MTEEVSRSAPIIWKTAAQLARSYVGGDKGIALKMQELRLKLIDDVMDQAGLNLGDAVETVSNHLVGYRRINSLRCSSEAVHLLDLKVKSDYPVIESSWQSARQIKSKYKGSLSTLNKKFECVRLDFIEAIETQTKIAPELAVSLVSRYLIGPGGQRSGGRKTLFASPTAISYMVNEKTLEPRNDTSLFCDDIEMVRDESHRHKEQER